MSLPISSHKQKHGPECAAILVTSSLGFAEQVKTAIEVQGKSLPRHDLLTQAFKNYGVAFVTANIAEAVALANEIAPEHLELHRRESYGLAWRSRKCRSYLRRSLFSRSSWRLHCRTQRNSTNWYRSPLRLPANIDDFLKKPALFLIPRLLWRKSHRQLSSSRRWKALRTCRFPENPI